MRRFWQIYLGAYAALLAMAGYWLVHSPDLFVQASWDQKLAYLTAPVGALGLFGYAYRRRLLWRWWWIVVFAVALANQLLYGLYQMAGDWDVARQYYAASPTLALATLGVWIFLLPYFAGLYLYAFRSVVWSGPAADR
jgi:hypothetical protein